MDCFSRPIKDIRETGLFMSFGDLSSVIRRWQFQVFFPLQWVTLIHPFGKLVLSQPFNSLYLSNPLASYFCVIHLFDELFRANHITLHPSLPLATYFSAVHSLGELSSCRSFNFSPFGELFLFRPFNSSFFEKLVSCLLFNSPSVRPLGQLFSCRPFNFPSFGELFLCHLSLSELFACRLFNSQFARPFGELILYRPSLERVIFVPSIPWAHYFRANCLTLHPSIDLASYFYQLFKSLSVRRLIFCYEFTSGSFGHL